LFAKKLFALDDALTSTVLSAPGNNFAELFHSPQFGSEATLVLLTLALSAGFDVHWRADWPFCSEI
jgi:hypothetical protein